MVGKISRCIGSLAVIRYFLRFMRPLPPTWRMAALGAALVVLSGCSTLEVKYEPVTQTDFSARSQPAKISNESELSLIERGYAKIGTVQANTETETDPTPLVLEKAASKGGDLVVLYRNNESSTEKKHTRRCAQWGYVTYAYREWTCVEWRSVYAGAVHTRHSAGTVWRYEPDLAKQAKEELRRKQFFLAVLSGDLRLVQDGLAQGLSPNASPTGRLPLIEAAERGHLAVVKLLVERGADVNAKDNAYGETALMRAAKGGYTETVKLLLARGADASVGPEGRLPLVVAAEGGHLAVVKLLIARGADVNGRNKREAPEDVTALAAAAEVGHTEIVKALLARGADVNLKNGRGITPLFTAARLGHTETVKALLAGGADANVRNKFGWTPLFIAAGEGHTETMRALLAHGADVNAKSEIGETALMSPAANGKTVAVQALLAGGADVNAKSDNRLTALIGAAKWGHTAAVQALLAKRADVSARDKDGGTALTYATKGGHTAVVKLLKEAGAKE